MVSNLSCILRFSKVKMIIIIIIIINKMSSSYNEVRALLSTRAPINLQMEINVPLVLNMPQSGLNPKFKYKATDGSNIVKGKIFLKLAKK